MVKSLKDAVDPGAKPAGAARGVARALPFVRADPAGEGYRAMDGRRGLHASRLVFVEDVAVSPGGSAPPGYTETHRFAVTYLGAAEWRIGSREALVDANAVLTLRAGEAYQDRSIGRATGRAAVVVEGAAAVLDEMGFDPHGAHDRRIMARPAGLRLVRLSHAMLSAAAGAMEPLRGDELALEMLGLILALDAPRRGDAPPRLIRAAKERLHAAPDDDPPRLQALAADLGCSPVYLTQQFAACEGMPLYRYYSRLRLCKALVGLRACEDITRLALDLGYSSHSHFTQAFRAAFGLTPSAYRRSVG